MIRKLFVNTVAFCCLSFPALADSTTHMTATIRTISDPTIFGLTLDEFLVGGTDVGSPYWQMKSCCAQFEYFGDEISFKIKASPACLDPKILDAILVKKSLSEF